MAGRSLEFEIKDEFIYTDDDSNDVNLNQIYMESLDCSNLGDLSNSFDDEDTESSTATSTCSDVTDDLSSVRSCGGEPYHSDFFLLDLDLDGVGTEIYYLRHLVLFNLYNFPGGVGTNSTRFAGLELIECEFNYFFRDYHALINVENNNM